METVSFSGLRWRENVSRLRTIFDARSASEVTFSRLVRTLGLRSGRRSESWEKPITVVKGLFSSWATPEISSPKEIIFSGRHLGAEEAHDIVLADKVIPAAQLLEAAMADAGRWAAGPTIALGAAKQSLNDALRLPIEAGLAVEVEAFQRCFRTADAREGVAAFVEKREAAFEGR